MADKPTKVGALERLTQKYNVDVGANRILKYDQSWYSIAAPEGDVDLKSVTTVLDVFPKGMGFKLWLQKYGDDADRIRDEAGQMGTRVHKMIEVTLRGEVVIFENEDGTRNCSLEEWERYLSWCLWYQEERKTNDMKPLFIEQIVYSVDLGVAGTVDLIAQTKRGIEIYDWKTGSFVGDTAEIQVSTYLVLANLMKVFGEVGFSSIVQMNPSLNRKGFRVTEVEDVQENFKTFGNCLNIWNRVNKKAVPKYRTYPNKVDLTALDAGEIGPFDHAKIKDKVAGALNG